MRTTLRFAVGLLSLAVITPASAADLSMPTKAPPPPPPPRVFNWTGFYIGANGGGGWAHNDFNGTEVTPFGPTAFSGSGNGSGGLAGGQLGFNYELPSQIVLGIEADADWANIAGSASTCSTYTGGPFTGFVAGCATDNVTLNDFGTVRGRLGYAFNNVLLYGTGGWAWGYASGNHTTTCVAAVGFPCPSGAPFTGGVAFTGGRASASNNLSGWTAGAGIEWGFLPNWTLRLEYLHLEFDNVSTTFTATVTTAAGTGTYTTHVSTNTGTDIVRAGVNYRFNWGAPP